MFKRTRSTDDFAEEIKAHLELEADELKCEGLSEDEARRKARLEFGNVRAAQERFYLRNRVAWLDNLVRDIKFAIRQLVKNPGFSIHRDTRACSRYRCVRGDLRFCGCGFAGAASVCKSRSADVGERKQR